MTLCRSVAVEELELCGLALPLVLPTLALRASATLGAAGSLVVLQLRSVAPCSSLTRSLLVRLDPSAKRWVTRRVARVCTRT